MSPAVKLLQDRYGRMIRPGMCHEVSAVSGKEMAAAYLYGNSDNIIRKGQAVVPYGYDRAESFDRRLTF